MNAVLPSLPHNLLWTSGFSSSSTEIASPPNKIKNAYGKHLTKDWYESFEKQTPDCIVLTLFYLCDF